MLEWVFQSVAYPVSVLGVLSTFMLKGKYKLNYYSVKFLSSNVSIFKSSMTSSAVHHQVSLIRRSKVVPAGVEFQCEDKKVLPYTHTQYQNLDDDQEAKWPNPRMLTSDMSPQNQILKVMTAIKVVTHFICLLFPFEWIEVPILL